MASAERAVIERHGSGRGIGRHRARALDASRTAASRPARASCSTRATRSSAAARPPAALADRGCDGTGASSSSAPGRVGVNSRASTETVSLVDRRRDQHVGRLDEVELQGQADRALSEVERRRAGGGGPEPSNAPAQEQGRLGLADGVVQHHPGGHEHDPSAGQLVQSTGTRTTRAERR